MVSMRSDYVKYAFNGGGGGGGGSSLGLFVHINSLITRIYVFAWNLTLLCSKT